ncbi:MAG TPA: hypothetical protein VEB20_04160 [Azospirillaceae bacterium]|nr:hypothetical protein [Azospirillaceae bacterium]
MRRLASGAVGFRAGAAGITLALGLAGSALRVVVLEAGGEDFDAEVQDAYRGSQ